MPFNEFKEIYRKVPRLCVDIIVKTEEGIVLAKRDIPPAKGMWHIPGGTVLMDETNEEAVKRVAKEELGLQVEIDRLLGVIEYFKEFAFGQSTGIVYLVRITGGNLRGSKDAEEVGFFKTIPENTIPEQVKFLREQLMIK